METTFTGTDTLTGRAEAARLETARGKILVHLGALSEALRKTCPHEGDDLPVNLEENAARIALADEAWIVLKDCAADENGDTETATLAFHPGPDRRGWIRPDDPDTDLKECLLATVEDGEAALDFALNLRAETEKGQTLRLAHVKIGGGRITEQP